MQSLIGCRMRRARRCVLTAAACAAVSGSVAGATRAVQLDVASVEGAPKFEVASIRPTKDNRSRGLIDASIEAELVRAVLVAAQKGRFRTTGLSLHELIQLAYDVRDFQIQRGPSWVRSERFAIDARAAGTATLDQARAMLRSLLADRFKLMVRREAQTRPVYELVPAARGLKITPLKEGDCITLNEKTGPPVPMDLAKPVYICGGYRRKILTLPPERTDRIEAGGIPMSKLVDILSDDVGRTVIDRTGFTERFNLLLDFAPQQDLGVGPAVSSGPTIFTALQERLGLRLQATAGPVDVVVIDGAERPSEN